MLRKSAVPVVKLVVENARCVIVSSDTVFKLSEFVVNIAAQN